MKLEKVTTVSKKPKNRREREKYPALKPELNLKTRYELIDYDYLHKLNEEELEYLNQFTDESVNSNLNRKNLNKNLHNTKALKKDCDRMNNARNRCVYTRAKASGNYTSIDEMDHLKNDYCITDNPEDDLINKIDNDSVEGDE